MHTHWDGSLISSFVTLGSKDPYQHLGVPWLGLVLFFFYLEALVLQDLFDRHVFPVQLGLVYIPKRPLANLLIAGIP